MEQISPKLSGLKINFFFLNLSFYGSDLGAAYLTSGSVMRLLLLICRLCLRSPEGLTGARRSASKLTHPHGFWQEVSVPCQVDLSIELLECPHDEAGSLPCCE